MQTENAVWPIFQIAAHWRSNTYKNFWLRRFGFVQFYFYQYLAPLVLFERAENEFGFQNKINLWSKL